jgi:hypothetical protein
MDGNMDIKDQVRLMRSVMGRKIMEIDEYADKAAQATGDEAAKYLALVDFLKNDIAGYKTIIDDLKDGTNDLTGNLYDIASLPEEALGVYNDEYLPSLSPEDLADEKAAMNLKVEYAQDLANSYAVRIGKAALTNDLVLNLMMSNDDILAAVGALVAQDAEIMSALTNEGEAEAEPQPEQQQ